MPAKKKRALRRKKKAQFNEYSSPNSREEWHLTPRWSFLTHREWHLTPRCSFLTPRDTLWTPIKKHWTKL